MLEVIGALVLTGLFLYASWGIVSLAWLFTAMDDWGLEATLFFLFWFAVWLASAVGWWLLVGTHVSIGFA